MIWQLHLGSLFLRYIVGTQKTLHLELGGSTHQMPGSCGKMTCHDSQNCKRIHGHILKTVKPLCVEIINYEMEHNINNLSSYIPLTFCDKRLQLSNLVMETHRWWSVVPYVAEMRRGRQMQLLAAISFSHEVHSIFLRERGTQSIPFLEELQSKSTREMVKSDNIVNGNT